MKIYTKKGDKGYTRLASGIEVSKSSMYTDALGAVDELNSVLGLAAASSATGYYAPLIREIQKELFTIGAELSLSKVKFVKAEEAIKRLEDTIDQYDKLLPTLKNFILPGGSVTAAWFHHARTVCRRAEREVVRCLKEQTPCNYEIIVYLNRLSDLLFTLARYANNYGASDVVWTHD